MGEQRWSALDLLELPALLAPLWMGLGLLARAVRCDSCAGPAPRRGRRHLLANAAPLASVGPGALVVLQLWGFDVSSLALFGGVVGVGLGFGLQNVASNFVSGLLLALERPIQPGDFVTVGAFAGSVQRIGARSTEIRTSDHVSILVPNARFLEGEVVNWSHRDPACKLHVRRRRRVRLRLGRVRAALLEATRKATRRSSPTRVRPWTSTASATTRCSSTSRCGRADPRTSGRSGSDLHYRIEASLRRHGLAVPFPQRDLHLRSPGARAADATRGPDHACRARGRGAAARPCGAGPPRA